ncbi:MAG TPA: response regulator transcription factor [Iamia sp.]
MTAPAPDPHPRPRPRILLAEDDVRLAGAFARRLEAEHLAVDVVGSVTEAREEEQRGVYACLVFDRLLPDGDVLDLVRELDERADHPPIVLVSAVADQEDRVLGLRAGADDYVGKPVHLEELAARVTRLVGAIADAGPDGVTRLALGPVVLDPARRQVRVDGELLLLPLPQLLILQRLMGRPERAVAADDLLAACIECDDDTVTRSSLPAHVDALARALDGHLVIEKAPRRGYLVRSGPGPVAPSLPRRLIRRVVGRPVLSS